ncbi:4-hydroxythreonine-4-phosphate dehydrogenase PdxA [Myxococcus llanfairpwllgwyngyllgogerychwyrndrobwllllantysiliogogogochensis]|uniref:4-hydroxythreonine-4-phosphate dehydrogenase PdxA n=1 Tax=Myxococcus llanfairpwllgwyngyllgogerychwyrndrobwllllantysiliogogogochensis TaxID=2590453 RepID=A0A540WLS0_9BACT|nr:4-hydroxythreonine-4-phosphate dehydrogenase PdxA [Myxococcus llanfairpwllgwyngyllgogerychwyrndrobwllllantysiliogogogochensis]NTX09987.1 4-hydroxythreonine-4-phosphate dehydrogenase PdxA [Myxococcus sp. CA056]TQF09959.1 4-hydroxythreonine-4-phosphate dehydrogenase PdxA [Myxococcus llanfairpwllgwyngyllgogerychwyrndrobwllllantysiliogogogochensis]
MSLPLVGISLGDVSGIGPEVTAAALALPAVRRALIPVVFGDGPTLERFPFFRRHARVEPSALGRVESPTVVVVTQLAARDRVPGKPSREGGRAQYAYVTAAIDAMRAGHVDALCTAPVSKEGISRAGIPFMGHTEVLAEAFGVDVMMMMDGPRVRIALATNHVPISALSKLLTVEGLTAQLKLLSRSLAPVVVGRRPRIAVLGLNPHAGEGGLLGREEVEVIGPAIRKARAAKVDAHGPIPADGLFARPDEVGARYDAVLAMYHDQGLIPAKALDFERTVNVTLGLPVPRTSPDHGTAYAIAGKGQASCVPMAEALLKAAQLARPPARGGRPGPRRPSPRR